MSYNSLFGLGTHSEDASLEGWWPLQDDAASTAVDDASSNGRDGTLTGGDNTADISTTGPNSWLAKGLHLDGSVDYVALPTWTGTIAAGSLIVWANLDAKNIYDGLMCFRGKLTMYVRRSGDANDMSINWSNAAGEYEWDSNVSATTGAWKMYSLSVDSAVPEARLYVDGALGATNTSASLSATPTLTSLAFSIGADALENDRWVDGLVAGAAFFSRALVADEHDECFDGPEPVNSVAPAVTGTQTEGQVLSCTTGTWGLDAPFSGGTNGTITYGYQWTRSNDAGGTGEADIGSATASTYTLVAGDVGKYIRCRVRGMNTGGFDSAADTNSNMTGAIASSGPATGSPYYYQRRRRA